MAPDTLAPESSDSRAAQRFEREAERADRFRRVAAYRANRALDYLESLLRTAQRDQYSFTEEQAAEVISKLRLAVDQLEAAYGAGSAQKLRVEL